MRKYLLVILSLIIGIGGAIFVYQKIHFTEVIKSFSQERLLLLIPYFAVSLLVLLVLTWRWSYILKSQKVRVPFINLAIYRFISNSVSYITPSAKLGGEFVRALLLKRHNVPLKKGFSTVFIDKSLELSFHAIFFVIGIFVVIYFYAFQKETEFYFILVSIIFTLLLVIFFYHAYVEKRIFSKIYEKWKLSRFKCISRFEKTIYEFDRLIIDFFHKDKKDFFATMAISALSWGAAFLEFKIALYIIGINASLIQIFLIFSFVGVAYLIPIPMALGALEGSQVSVFKLLGLQASMGVALALVIRVRDSVFAIIGLLALGAYGLRFKRVLKKSYNKKC